MNVLSQRSFSIDALSPRKSRPSVLQSVGGIWAKSRPLVLITLPLLLGVLTAALFVAALQREATNTTIRALKSNHDVAVTTDAAPEAMLARIEFLLAHDRVDDIQPYMDGIDKRGSDKIRADAHYDFANGRLRQGFDKITNDKLDEAGPFVVLSRQEYRRALTFAPDRWDAKFNLDVASRLIRDFPAFERTIGDEVKTDRKKIWTDIPGKPEGLP